MSIEISEEILSCTICFEDYDFLMKNPICIECGHTICNECLESIISSSNRKCPFCNKTLLYSQSSYPINYAYKNIISEYQEKKKKENKRLASELTQIKEFEFNEGYYQGQLVVVFKNKHKLSIRHGNGKIIYNNGDVYNGEWVNNLKSGYGIYQFSNGNVYEGKFSSDFPNGEGKIVYERYEINGIKSYKGSFRDGKYNGIGVIEYEDGSFLESVFHYGKIIDSRMSKLMKDDKIYYGKIDISMKENIKNIDKSFLGLVYNTKSGETRQGYFNNNLEEHDISNSIVIYFPNGDVFKGKYDSQERKFIGRNKNKTGDVAEGDFNSEYRLEGKGVILMKSGEKREGLFKDGRLNGIGRVLYSNGDEYNGEFNDDKKHGKGVLLLKSKGVEYDGDFINDVKSGNGHEKYVFLNESYFGEFHDDKKEGNGIYTFSNNDTYKGEFKNDQMHGKGNLISHNGDEVKGIWKNGKHTSQQCLVY